MARRTIEKVGEQQLATARGVERSVVLLLCILAAGTLLRAMALEDAFPSQDELWSLELSTGRGSAHLDLPVNEFEALPPFTQLDGTEPPWTAVWTSLDRVTHPPLYFLALRGWREAFGHGDLAARVLSVVASLAAILLLYDATRLLTGSRTTALWSAALMALAAPQVEHARIVRNYAVLLMLGVLAWWAVARLREARRPRLADACAALLGVAVAAMLLTHYFAAGAVAALLAYAVLGMTGAARRRAAVAVVAGTVAWLAAWGPTLWRHAGHFSGQDSTTDFLRRDATGAAARFTQTLSDLAGVPVRLMIELPQRPIPWAAVGGVACLALVVTGWRGRRRELLLPILWLAGTVGFVALLDLVRLTIHLQAVRYTLLASPGLFVLIAAGLTSSGARSVGFVAARHALPVVATLICLFGLAEWLIRPPAFDWRPLAAFLDEPGRANDPVIFVRAGDPDWYVGHHVLAYAHASQLPPGRPVVVLEPPVPEALLDRLRASPRAWAVHLSDRPLSYDAAFPDFETGPADVPGFPPVLREIRPVR